MLLSMLAFMLGFLMISAGCQSEPPSKASQAVVRKKISTPADTEPKQKTQAKPVHASPKPAASPQKAEQKPGPTPPPTVQENAKTAPTVEKETAKGASQTAPSEPVMVSRRPPSILVDPFEPLFREEKPAERPSDKKVQKRKKRVPQTPLEKIDLGQLKLTAIIRTPAGNKALVEESSGKGYIIDKGTWIGVHSGQVQQITEDAVIVEEEIENAIGEVALTTRELKLQKPPGE
jgi:type IV pilus assembly protein PilP